MKLDFGLKGCYNQAMSNFSIWLKNQMSKRQWGNRETARQAGIAHVTIGKLLLGETPPTVASCTALAKAFGEDPNSVFYIAGLMQPSDPEILPEFTEYLRKITLEEQRHELNILRAIRDEQKSYK